MRNISASSRAMSRLVAPLTILALLAIWQLVCSAGLVPPFMLPSPIRVVQALVGDWPLLMAGKCHCHRAYSGIIQKLFFEKQ